MVPSGCLDDMRRLSPEWDYSCCRLKPAWMTPPTCCPPTDKLYAHQQPFGRGLAQCVCVCAKEACWLPAHCALPLEMSCPIAELISR
jgi:hypothetical protein